MNSYDLDEQFESVYLNGYLRPGTLEISMNQEEIKGDLSPTYVRNLPNFNVTNMPSDTTPFLFKTLFPHSKYIVTVRNRLTRCGHTFITSLGRR